MVLIGFSAQRIMNDLEIYFSRLINEQKVKKIAAFLILSTNAACNVCLIACCR